MLWPISTTVVPESGRVLDIHTPLFKRVLLIPRSRGHGAAETFSVPSVSPWCKSCPELLSLRQEARE